MLSLERYRWITDAKNDDPQRQEDLIPLPVVVPRGGERTGETLHEDPDLQQNRRDAPPGIRISDFGLWGTRGVVGTA